MDSLIFYGIVGGITFVVLLTLGVTLSKMYKRASKEQSFVRTGAGGQKVVKDGGCLVLPVFHETIPINMQTLRLLVSRKETEALITKDRLRVDVSAEFYVRVKPDEESIATAAQTLGQRTLNPLALKELIEGKFVDALRAVAAGMEMQDLHEQRADFVQKVQNTVAEDLTKNGLELESVSLTGLDQTDPKFFNTDNAFDAEGLTKLRGITEERRRERNEIEANARVAIETKNLEADKASLALAQDKEFATLEQQREVSTRRMEQEAQLAAQKAEREREAEVARLTAEQAREEARVVKEQAVKSAEVQSNRTIKTAEIEAAKAVQIAEVDRQVTLANKSEEQSNAQAKADEARALAVGAAEEVTTVQAAAQAEREKKVAVIAAERDAEKDATRIRVMAEAEKQAADNTAAARERAIEVDARSYEVEAAGKRALAEAANLQSTEQVNFLLRSKFLDQLPAALAEMVKPIQHIDSFRVVNLTGLNGNGHSGDGEGGSNTSTGNVPTDLTNAVLNYQLQSPIVSALAGELNIDLSKGMNGLLDAAGGLKVIKTDPVTGDVIEKPARTTVRRTTPATGASDTVDNAQEIADLQRLSGIDKK